MAVKKEVIEKFAIEYATLTTKHSIKWWGERYSVNPQTITKWLARTSIQEIIEKETVTFAESMRLKAEKNAGIAMKKLMEIIKSDKHTDVQRKACLDVLGLCHMKNVNKENPTTNNFTNKNYIGTTNKDLDKDYDELLGRNHKRKKTSAIKDSEPGSPDIN